MNAIQKYSIRYVVTVSDQLHRLTVIHKSSPVASWDRKVSIRCTLQNQDGSSKSSCYFFCLLLLKYYEFGLDSHTVYCL